MTSHSGSVTCWIEIKIMVSSLTQSLLATTRYSSYDSGRRVTQSVQRQHDPARRSLEITTNQSVWRQVTGRLSPTPLSFSHLNLHGINTHLPEYIYCITTNVSDENESNFLRSHSGQTCFYKTHKTVAPVLKNREKILLKLSIFQFQYKFINSR